MNMLITCYNPDITAPNGMFVRLLRDRLGWTQGRLAKHLGVSTVLISMVEGGSKPVTIGLLKKIAKKCLVNIEIKITS